MNTININHPSGCPDWDVNSSSCDTLHQEHQEPFIIIRSWLDTYCSQKLAIASIVKSYDISNGCEVDHYLALIRIKPDEGEVFELHSEVVTLDFDDNNAESLWLEAMLSWGDELSKRQLVPSPLDADERWLVEFSIDNSLRGGAQ